MSTRRLASRALSRLLAVALSAGLSVLLAGCGFLPKEKVVPEPTLPEPPTTTSAVSYPVKRGDIAEAVEGTAEVTSVRSVVLYFKEPGRIKEINVSAMQTVAEGDILARLDIGDLEHELRLAQIDQQIAQVTRDRMNVVGAGSFDKRIQDLAIAKANETVSYLQERVDASTIRAPFAGIVETVDAQPSDRVQDYSTIMEITDPTQLELQLKVTRQDYDMIHTGQASEINSSQDQWTPTTVTEVTHLDPTRDVSVRVEQFIVHLRLPKGIPDSGMGRALAVRVVLQRHRNTLTIPLAALREFEGRTYVRVIEGDARHEQDVRVGIRTQTDAEILEGLQEGQRVIGR